MTNIIRFNCCISLIHHNLLSLDVTLEVREFRCQSKVSQVILHISILAVAFMDLSGLVLLGVRPDVL